MKSTTVLLCLFVPFIFGCMPQEEYISEMEILENHSYHRRLLMYKGEIAPDSLLDVQGGDDRALTLATQGYGVGNWFLYTGDEARALEVFQDVVAGDFWAAFGYLAAEADLHRLITGG